MKRLLAVQSATTRLVYGAGRRDQVTPHLRNGCRQDSELSSKLLSSFGSVSMASLQSSCSALKWTASVVAPDCSLRLNRLHSATSLSHTMDRRLDQFASSTVRQQHATANIQAATENVSICGMDTIRRFCCQHGKAPQQAYLLPSTSVSDVPARQRLRSSSRHHLDVPRHRLSTYGRRAFSAVGTSVWNSLPVELRDPDISIGSFRRQLKTWLFSKYQRIRGVFM